MSPRKVTIDDIRAVAEANPDKENPRYLRWAGDGDETRYFDGGCPSCIVGHALALNGFIHSDVVEGSTPDAQDNSHLFASEVEAEMATRVQERADDGVTWAEAVLELSL